MYQKIIDNVFIATDKQKLLEEIEVLENTKFETEETTEKVLNEQVRVWVADEIRREHKEEGVKLEEYLAGLKKKLEELELIKITLAYEPSRQDLGEIYFWLKKNSKRSLIIDLGFDERILGGAIVELNGEYRDYSLLKLTETEIEKALSKKVNPKLV